MTSKLIRQTTILNSVNQLFISKSLRHLLSLNDKVMEIDRHFSLFTFEMFIFQECNRGKFGANCAYECGHCLHKEKCHYVDGTCLNGCDDGYRGTQCKSSK